MPTTKKMVAINIPFRLKEGDEEQFSTREASGGGAKRHYNHLILRRTAVLLVLSIARQ